MKKTSGKISSAGSIISIYALFTGLFEVFYVLDDELDGSLYAQNRRIDAQIVAVRSAPFL